MNAFIVNQTPFQNDFASELKKELIDLKNKKLRVLVAYISWDGVKDIYNELESFYDCKSNSIEMIIGLGDSFRELDVLEYLNDRMPDGKFMIFNASNPEYTFHPKIYLFDKKDKLTVFIGSSNLSIGGIRKNSECMLKLNLDRKKDHTLIEEFNSTWSTYNDPKKPFGLGCLKDIDAMLKQAKSIRVKNEKSTQKSQIKKKNPLKDLFPEIDIPTSKSTLTLQNRKTHTTQKNRLGKGSILLMEVKEETGGGSQVQFPSAVFTDYFSFIKGKNHKTIELCFSGDEEFRPAVLCKFDNKTFRCTIREIIGYDRPLILKFEKNSLNGYFVTIIQGANFDKQIKKCIYQTRRDAKRWIII